MILWHKFKKNIKNIFVLKIVTKEMSVVYFFQTKFIIFVKFCNRKNVLGVLFSPFPSNFAVLKLFINYLYVIQV